MRASPSAQRIALLALPLLGRRRRRWRPTTAAAQAQTAAHPEPCIKGLCAAQTIKGSEDTPNLMQGS